MTIEEIAAMPGGYTLPGFTPGNLYAFWDGDDPQEWTVARYSAHGPLPFYRREQKPDIASGCGWV